MPVLRHFKFFFIVCYCVWRAKFLILFWGMISCRRLALNVHKIALVFERNLLKYGQFNWLVTERESPLIRWNQCFTPCVSIFSYSTLLSCDILWTPSKMHGKNSQTLPKGNIAIVANAPHISIFINNYIIIMRWFKWNRVRRCENQLYSSTEKIHINNAKRSL